jgi:hypothetical protein
VGETTSDKAQKWGFGAIGAAMITTLGIIILQLPEPGDESCKAAYDYVMDEAPNPTLTAEQVEQLNTAMVRRTVTCLEGRG